MRSLSVNGIKELFTFKPLEVRDIFLMNILFKIEIEILISKK